MDHEGVLSFLTITGLSMISIGLVLLLKPLEVGMFIRPMVIANLYISQSTILSLGKISIIMGVLVLLIDEFLKLREKNAKVRH